MSENRYNKKEYAQQGQFMVGILVATKKRGLTLDLPKITERDIARLATKTQSSPTVWLWAKDLFKLDGRGRYQNFRDCYMELCGHEPLIKGVADLADVVCNPDIVWIIKSLELKSGADMLKLFTELSEALIPN